MGDDAKPILGTTTQLWPDPDDGPWHITMTWADVGGRAECVGVELWNGAVPQEAESEGQRRYRPLAAGPSPLLASDVRSLPLAGIIQTARTKLRSDAAGLREMREHFRSIEMPRPAEGPLAEVLADLGHPTAAEVDARHQRYIDRLGATIRSIDERPASRGAGRKPELGPTDFAEAAAVYLAAWERGQPPTKAVMEHFHISKSAAAKRVARCRELGLIAPTTPGKPSGSTEGDNG